MRYEAEGAEQRFTLWNGVIAHFGMGVEPDESAQVAGPYVTASQLACQVNAEVGFETGFVVDGFVVGAHGFKGQVQVCAA
jgi:hypothetical protein